MKQLKLFAKLEYTSLMEVHLIFSIFTQLTGGLSITYIYEQDFFSL